MTFPKTLLILLFPIYVIGRYFTYYTENYMKLSTIKKDVNAAEQGVWVNGVLGDLDVKVASAGNRKYIESLRNALKPYQRNLKNIDDEVFAEIQNKCVAKHVLLDWRNLQDDAGNDIPYSYEKAFELLNDPENEEFRKLVISLSEEAEVFRKEALESLAGN